jgi:hypothetical protein
LKIKSDQTDDGRYTIEVASHNVVPLTSNLTSPYSPPLQASAPPIILTNPFNSVTNGVGAAVVGAGVVGFGVGAAVVGLGVGAAVVGAAVVGLGVGFGVGQSAHALIVVTVLELAGWYTCLT